MKLFNKGKSDISSKELINSINNVLNNKALCFTPEDTGSTELSNKLNELLNTKKPPSNSDLLLHINSILKEVIGLNEIRDMLNSVVNQSTSMSNIAVNSDELLSSIDNVKKLSNDLYSFSTSTSKESSTSLNNVSESINYTLDVIKEFNEIGDKIRDFEKSLGEIIGITNVINEIADNISLLALNASIEASRAGESGRGFSVVASEVKKLSEHTKITVKNIGENIDFLNTNTSETFKLLRLTINKLANGQDFLNKTLDSIKNIDLSINNITKHIAAVTLSIEQQTASTKDLYQNITSVNSQTILLEDKCTKTARDVYEISKYIQDIRKVELSKSNDLSNNARIEIYKVDHLLWRWKVYNMLLSIDTIDVNVASDYRNCGLGKWYYSEKPNMINNKDFALIESPHINLHNAARDAITLYKNGDIDLAEEKLNEMDSYSKIIINALDKLKV